MRVMFFVGKMFRRRSALWLVFPATLLLVTFFISHSANSRISSVPSPSLSTRIPTRTEPNPAADVDHDGLPDTSELRSFNDRDQHPNKRWRPLASNPNFLGFYRLKLLEG
jgi:hypothetical protein